jgi:hypothetical protein
MIWNQIRKILKCSLVFFSVRMLDKLQGKPTKIDLANSAIIIEIDTSGNNCVETLT